MASKRPNVYLYMPQIQGVLYSKAPLTKADMFYFSIGLVHCEVKQNSK